ncbi:uncharacterized protein LOC106637354 isoform X2 [Copidosoma floridanum]|uniref:uncharacterized protein LOC106637354 isoform X2 n=1 Tax=Copidosoma floridanum TaxID=29053 RepID=UPI000C6F756A|nr:uncharacterized protein LOC106637354 isoform X2 [Copidosoma floridanum]
MAEASDSAPIKHDPDYFVSEENETEHQNIFEESARSSTVKKISAIIEKEFTREIETKKEEVKAIYKALTKATKTMHYLRYAIVKHYYSQGMSTDPAHATLQSRLHPTVNAPKRKVPYNDMEYNCWEELGVITEKKRLADERAQSSRSTCNDKPSCSKDIDSVHHVTGANHKITKRIVVGNLSKWLVDSDSRGKNNATHKWKVYIEDIEKSDLSSIFSKVKFFLHPSYKPHDVIEVTSPPFHLARLGWGEFPVRIQLHFTNAINKPVDIIHHLTLDKTFTGLQTCGAQTVVELTISTKRLTSAPVIDLEGDEEKDCNDSEIQSDLDLLLKNRITDEQSNITIHHDLPSDHDYVNINPKLSQESSNSEKQENHSKLNNLCNENSTATKLDSNQQPLLPEKTVSIQKELDAPNSQDSSKKDNVSTNPTPAKYLSKEGITEALVHLINHAKPESLPNILKIIATKTPIITEKALIPHYKAQHPYACESYAVYCSYSRAKQRAIERQRAIRALEILSKSKHKADISIKDFVTWARRYGFTPIDSTACASKTKKSAGGNKKREKIEVSSTVIQEANQWIKELESKEGTLKLDDDDNEEVDVMSVQQMPTYRKRVPKPNELQAHTEMPQILLEYPETTNSLLEYVRNVTDRRGITLRPEELFPETVEILTEKKLRKISPSVVHSTSSLIVSKAVECFIEDILRLSHSCAVDRCDKDAVFIDVDDVRAALLKRDEFELLTNSGLGTDD